MLPRGRCSAAKKLVDRHPGPEAPALQERGLWWDTMARFLRSVHKLPPRAVWVLKQALGGAVPTAEITSASGLTRCLSTAGTARRMTRPSAVV
eukprot:472980-Pyramimonas_sp.AAC.1